METIQLLILINLLVVVAVLFIMGHQLFNQSQKQVEPETVIVRHHGPRWTYPARRWRRRRFRRHYRHI